MHGRGPLGEHRALSAAGARVRRRIGRCGCRPSRCWQPYTRSKRRSIASSCTARCWSASRSSHRRTPPWRELSARSAASCACALPPYVHRDWAQLPPRLHRDWAHPCHICTGTGRTAATSAPGLRVCAFLFARRVGSESDAATAPIRSNLRRSWPALWPTRSSISVQSSTGLSRRRRRHANSRLCTPSCNVH
jgi:hypothetical protein